MNENYYQDLMIDTNGITWANGEFYQRLNKKLEINSQPIDGWYPIIKTKFGQVPPLAEILLLSTLYAECIGLTFNGELYSFLAGQSFNLGARVISIHMCGGTNIEFVALLEDGRLRMIQVDRQSGEPVSVNSDIIDVNVNAPIVQLCTLYDNLLLGRSSILGNQNVDLPVLLAITADNQYLIIKVSNLRGQKTAHLTIIREVENVNINYLDIIMLRSGTLLTTDGRVYSLIYIADPNEISYLPDYNDGTFQFIQFNQIVNPVDILPISDIQVIIMNSSGELYSSNTLSANMIEYETLDRIIPNRFISYYQYDTESDIVVERIGINNINFQSIDRRIYSIEGNRGGSIVERDVPPSLIVSRNLQLIKSIRP